MPVIDRQLQFRGSALRVMENMRTASDVYDVMYEPAADEDPRAAIYDAFTDWQFGQESPFIPGYVCSQHTCDNGDSPVRYTVTVTYAIGGGGFPDAVPELQPPTFDGEGNEYEENLEVDLNGDPVETTAGEPMEPGTLTRTMSDFTFLVSRNYANTPGIVPWLASYANYVNSDNFLGGVPGTVVIRGVPRLTYVYPQGEQPQHWRVSWRFVYREPWASSTSPPANSAWFARVQNKGYLVNPGPPGLVNARDADGVLYTRPQWISTGGDTISATPNYLFFRRYPARPFAPLGIVAP